MVDLSSWELYPRPQMKRQSYLSLNGLWDFTVSADKDLPEGYDRQIRVPFCPESELSGIQEHFPEGHYLFYRKSLSFPQGFVKDRVLLHIGAADQQAEVFVNGQKAGAHSGGYWAFCVDITDFLQEENTLVIRILDDLRDQSQPYGKQTLTRGGMWYTPVSGIWQSVWLESVPKDYIQALGIENTGASVTVTVRPALEGVVNVSGLGTFPLENGQVTIRPEEPHLWSPEDPYLYEFTVETSCDQVESYFALRQLDIQNVAGIPRLCLNGKPYFFHGLLDQGYWPDGIYTPKTPERYRQDILSMKKLGFNTLRKHIKVEPEVYYYLCDRLGMVVFQDMVNNGHYSFFRDTALPTAGFQRLPDQNAHRGKKSRDAFLQGMEKTVNQLQNHPCICYWTVFNEGWGQFDSDNVYFKMLELDSTRFIDTTSGWFRRKNTQVESLHIYFGSWNKLRLTDKPLVLSEFGGYAWPVEGHLWNPDKAYGYRSCKTKEAFLHDVEALYREKVIPAAKNGLCAAIYTQLSDVEDEINGLLTYDREVCKAEADVFLPLALALAEAVQ